VPDTMRDWTSRSGWYWRVGWAECLGGVNDGWGASKGKVMCAKLRAKWWCANGVGVGLCLRTGGGGDEVSSRPAC
jgi:hypothetical protein